MTIYNFYAGPAMLPVEVMAKAKEEFTNYKGTQMSIMEIFHRGVHFTSLLAKAEKDLVKLLEIPENYSVIFFPAGATLQFSAIPLNLLQGNETADYAITGVWSKKAYDEAKRFFKVNVISDCQDNNYTKVKPLDDSMISENAKYAYITTNNTIYGTRYKSIPRITKAPLIADMTSELLSRKINVKDYGLIFAGAQKNIGPSGVTIVIIRKDLLEKDKNPVPVLLDYRIMAESKSLYNTPPTYPIYMAGLVFEWLLQRGGIEEMEKINEEKASLLYDFIDASKLYHAPVDKESRSIMNVVFWLRNKDLEKKFTEESTIAGLIGLEGYRTVGGFRASIYNAMPIQGVINLIGFMQEFEKKYL